MTRPLAPLLFAVGLGALGLAACSRAQPAPWLVNETQSLPRGLYRLTATAPSRGAVVALHPPPSARSYLSALGAPPDARLLKRVVAGRGDMVCRHGLRLTWPHGAVAAAPNDRHGRALPTWVGCRRLAADEVLVLGDTPKSFDSRYFGPVRTAAIDGAYREVWGW